MRLSDWMDKHAATFDRVEKLFLPVTLIAFAAGAVWHLVLQPMAIMHDRHADDAEIEREQRAEERELQRARDDVDLDKMLEDLRRRNEEEFLQRLREKDPD